MSAATGIRELRISYAGGADVSALLRMPADATALLAFAHGAGADMRHAFMEKMSESLAAQGIATLRYQFPYTERGRSRPDAHPVLFATIRAALETARERAAGMRLIAGGKSMGGRMTSMAASEAELPGVSGIVFFGFPLHPAGRAGVERADHLQRVQLPLLFLQGTRDALAEPALLKPVIAQLGPRATLHEIDGADHGFHVRRKTGRTDDDVLDELARTVSSWVEKLPK